jgi:hypothetical protein
MSDDRYPKVLPDEEEHVEGEEAPPPAEVEAAGAAVASEFAEEDPAFGGGLESASIAPRFAHLDPNRVIAPKLLEEALEFFEKHESKFDNKRVISVLDYGLRSTEPRFHVVDMQTGGVRSLRMSHGKGSDPNHDGRADSFSNVPGSNASSLGFARTAETYQGKHGLSLRLDGLSATNTNLRKRAVVVHGAGYVKDQPVIQGRSEGCPAVPMPQKDQLIGTIKGGSLMYFARS